MLLTITDYRDVDTRQFLALYRESIESAGRRHALVHATPLSSLYQSVTRSTRETSLLRSLAFLLEEEKCRFLIWADQDVWRSALLLFEVNPRRFYLDSLVTHPRYRRHGYALQLLRATFHLLQQSGPYTLLDCVSKDNIASLQLHEKAGFLRYTEIGYDYFLQKENPQCCGMCRIYPIPENDPSSFQLTIP